LGGEGYLNIWRSTDSLPASPRSKQLFEERRIPSIIAMIAAAFLLILLSVAEAAVQPVSLLILGSLDGEAEYGVMATAMVAAREINASPDRSLFGDCQPNITIQLRDHEVSTNTATQVLIDTFGEECGSTASKEAVVDGIVGPDYSSIAGVVSPVATVWDVPVVSYWATSPDLNRWGNFFRTIPNDEAAALGMLEYMNTNDITYCNLIFRDDGYGRGFENALLLGEESHGISMATFSTDESSESLSKLGLKIKESPVNCWVVVLGANEVAARLPILLDPVDRPVHFIFSETVSNSVVTQMKETTVRKISGSVVIKAQGLKPGHPQADALVKTLQESGISVAEYEAQPTAFSEAYADVRGIFPVPADVVAFSYDAVTALAIAVCNGADNKALNGLPEVEFEGVSGSVRFCTNCTTPSGTRDPATAYMTCAQLKGQDDGSTAFELENEFGGGLWLGDFSAIATEDGSSFVNLVPAAFEEVRVIAAVEGVVTALASFVMLASVVCAIWSRINCDSKIVRGSQKEFLYLICLGCVISSSVPIMMAHPSDFACQGAWIAYAFGFSISMGSLSAKTIRVYRMFTAANKMNLMKITFLQSLPPMLTIMFIDVGIAVAMQASGDVAYVEINLDFDQYGRVEKREYRCRNKGPYTTAFFLANIAILSYLACLCYLSRHLPIQFSESKYISMSVVSALQIVSLGFLLVGISDNTPTVDYLMVSLMTIITDGSTLFLIFAPKMYLLSTTKAAQGSVAAHTNASSSAVSALPSGVSVVSK
jgi:ABC-type branched-subunit amino acid transport system substrate-binding protein